MKKKKENNDNSNQQTDRPTGPLKACATNHTVRDVTVMFRVSHRGGGRTEVSK